MKPNKNPSPTPQSTAGKTQTKPAAKPMAGTNKSNSAAQKKQGFENLSTAHRENYYILCGSYAYTATRKRYCFFKNCGILFFR